MTESGVRIQDEGSLWVMYGEIDAAVQSRHEDDLLRHARAVPGRIRIDLSAVTFMDSGGLRLLYHAATAGDDRPALVGTPRRVRDLLELSGVDGLFELVEAP
ncbi:STAS domain-containing protein [Cellulosimicrobium marinum]|uniref:STAS domain-containing protein n=1 Tax=Cellulosimicrobium marinum TaxID=1638992 RepID=UPI001E2E4AF6|nr:STAS domain-containing protein [Cellulosimicrobium marinum]MCB7135339.1 STAS domain-containing protein [Cellulosimicrobium marinum]